ncbi:hypothetical protein QYE76_061689 [Lolium multiflorum]|uniref:Uncharacterized protein n=1 Tax=Lolium multiflorum TaxID=4521 RepID=A0AAD8S237_LOLMU|nr:hypothetical protein QYE76_061689 [Lolium multiflorum]
MAANVGNSKPAPLPLDGRVALVTGGSRGIGREVSSHLAALGARVVINYASDSAKASALATELNSRGLDGGVRAVAFQADVSDPASVRALFDHAEAAFGSPPHIVVASAGLLNPKCPALHCVRVDLLIMNNRVHLPPRKKVVMEFGPCLAARPDASSCGQRKLRHPRHASDATTRFTSPTPQPGSRRA